MQQDPGPAQAPTKAEAKAKAKAAKAKAKAAAGPLVPDTPLEMARKVLKVVMTQTTQARESALMLKSMKFSTELSAQLLECAAETEAIFQDFQRLVMLKTNDAADYMPVLQRVEAAKRSYEDGRSSQGAHRRPLQKERKEGGGNAAGGEGRGGGETGVAAAELNGPMGRGSPRQTVTFTCMGATAAPARGQRRHRR